MCSEGCRNGWPNYLYGTNGPGAAGHLFQEQFQVVKIDDLCTMTTMSHCTNLHLIAIYNVFLSQLSIGKMTHSRKQGRGIMDRSFKPIRMCFRRDCSYERMLEKSKAQLYSTQCQGASYYMADTSGTTVAMYWRVHHSRQGWWVRAASTLDSGDVHQNVKYEISFQSKVLLCWRTPR